VDPNLSLVGICRARDMFWVKDEICLKKIFYDLVRTHDKFGWLEGDIGLSIGNWMFGTVFEFMSLK